MITTRLSYTNYYLTIKRARNSEWQKDWKNSTSKLHYIQPTKEWESTHNSFRQYEIKLSRLHIGHIKQNNRHWCQKMISNKYAKIQYVETRNWLNIASWNAPNGGTAEKKYNMQGNIKTFLGRDCEEEKVIIKYIDILEEIWS